MKRTVKQWTGIPVSVGVAHTKTLSKLANHLAKKRQDGVFQLEANDPLLAHIGVGEVWGIGSASEKKLLAAGIRTVANLRDADDLWIQKELSIVGLRLVHELRGIPCLPLELVRPPKKGICVSRSFGKPITHIEEMKQAVATYAARASEKLRVQQLLAAAITVFMHTNPFANDPQYSRCHSLRLPVPSSAGNELIRWASELVDRLFMDGFRYKKAGILVTEIVSDTARQGNLFHHPNTARDDRVSAVMDKINRDYGRRTIQFAAEGIKAQWATRFDQRSPRYTTSWNELLEVSSD